MKESSGRLYIYVYYGEYTLRHWQNLMLTWNIDLLEYQRGFE